MNKQQLWSVVFGAALASGSALIGCDDHRDSAIIPPPQQTPTAQQTMQPQQAAQPQRQIVWQLPMTWKDAPSTQPGEMNVQVSPEHPELLLKGQILGTGPNFNLVSIVNAWEKLLGREPSDASTVEGSIVKPYIANDLHGYLVDLGMPDEAADRKRLIGAVFPDPQGVTMAFTLLGVDEQVAAQRENFRSFLETLRIVMVQSQPQQAQQQQASQSASTNSPFSMKYQTPPNWQAVPAQQGIDLDLRTGDPKNPVRLVVNRMTVENANAIMNDPNILRTQAGLTPLQQGEKQQAYKVAFGSEQGLIFDLQSKAGETPRKRFLFAIAQHGGIVVCVQLSGPVEQMEAHLPELETFLKAIEFVPVNK